MMPHSIPSKGSGPPPIPEAQDRAMQRAKRDRESILNDNPLGREISTIESSEDDEVEQLAILTLKNLNKGHENSLSKKQNKLSSQTKRAASPPPLNPLQGERIPQVPLGIDLYLERGKEFERQGDVARALKAYENSITFNKNGNSCLKYANLLMQTNPTPQSINQAIRLLLHGEELGSNACKYVLANTIFAANYTPEQKKKFESTLEAAHNGHPRACFETAIALMDGKVVKKNEEAAFQWLVRAYERGFHDADFSIGMMHLEGSGTRANPFQAFKWLFSSASRGRPDAAYNLALLYLNGIGVQANLAEALRWITISAHRGFEPALQLHQKLVGS